MQIKEIKEIIIAMSGNNPDFYNKLKPNGKPSIGVRNPELRKLAKEIVKDDYRKFLDDNPLDMFELDMLYAYVLGYAKDDINILLKYFEDFVPKIEDWAVNDALCGDFKIAKKYQKETFEVLMKFKNSKKEFETRVVAVTLLAHFINDKYIDRCFEIWNELYHDAYYSKMGLAWAIATAMAKYPDKTIAYMTNDKNKLDKWTYNKAIQKMKESSRVDEDKLKYLIDNRIK